jgi:predicted dehydrogenase
MKLAIVGCGAIAEIGYLPALAFARGVRPVLLVDRDLGRAKAMAERFAVPQSSSDVADVAKVADAACVALPHDLHEPIGRHLLENGVHVLMEKPLAITTADCDSLISAADKAGRILSVAMLRRYCPGNRLAQLLIATGSLGRVHSFHLESGNSGTWPARSPHILNRASGGGVLMDNGSHDVDLIMWLFGRIADVRCRTDAVGGLESNCTLKLAMTSGVAGFVELSRTRALRNSLVINGERAVAEIPLVGETAKIRFAGSPAMTINGRVDVDEGVQRSGQLFVDIMAAQMENMADAINQRRPPTVDGEAARETIEFIHRCYAAAVPMDLAWRRRIAFPQPCDNRYGHS